MRAGHGDPIKDSTGQPVDGLCGSLIEEVRQAITQSDWSRVVEMLIARRDPGSARLVRLSRNLECVRLRHPSIHEMIVRHLDRPIGRPRWRFDGVRDFDPIESDIQLNKPLALAGLADGKLLAALMRHARPNSLGQAQSITILETDPARLLPAFAESDLRPAIDSSRVRWYVGPGAFDDLARDLIACPMQAIPSRLVGPSALDFAPSLDQVLRAVQAHDRELGQRIESMYRDFRAEAFLAGVCRVEGSSEVRSEVSLVARRPRVLLLTSRFTTVLQHATRDADDGFARLGFDTLTLIESDDAEQLTARAVRAALCSFRPDLVFQIDHQRAEWGDLFPSTLPFVNWAQDHLPNLTTSAAGRAMGAGDFALLMSVERYTKLYDYPARQCMEFRKLTRFVDLESRDRPKQLAGENSWAKSLVYVSNWSDSPERVADRLVMQQPDATSRRIARDACDVILREARRNNIAETAGSIRRMVGDRLDGLETRSRHRLWSGLWEQLGNSLYRRQALRWAARIAREKGLDLAIFGRGWDRDAEFSRYARGVIAYGPELEQLTRACCATLVLEPYVCWSHQRLLDALSAGGRVIVRDHAAHRLIREIAKLVLRAGEPRVDSTDALRDRLDEKSRAELDRTIGACRDLSTSDESLDLVQTYGQLVLSGFATLEEPLLEALDDVTFSDEATLERRVVDAMGPADLLMAASGCMRRSAADRYDYAAGLGRVVKWMVDRLRERPLCLSDMETRDTR